MLAAFFAPLLDGDQLVLPDVTDPLFIACMIGISCWLLLLAAFVIATRPAPIEAAPATMDLRTETPAIVNMLVNGGRVTPVAVQATLLDLAAHDYIDVEEYGASEVICRVKSAQPNGPIDTATEMVLDHVKSQAESGIVVAQALTTGPKGRATSWFKRFTKAVATDAQSQGLIEDRWSRPMWGSIRVVGLAAGGLVILYGAIHDFLEPVIVAVAVVGLFLNQALVALFGQYKPSAAGRDAAAHWLGVRAYLQHNQAFTEATPGAVALWDRYMSYAAALGLAGQAVRALPMGAEDDHRAWSAYGGEWREVRIAYPHTRIVWGRSPFEALLAALVIGTIGGGLIWVSMQVLDAARGMTVDTHDIARWTEVGATIAILVGLLVVAVGVRTLLIALFDATTRREVIGEIVRLREFRHEENKTSYFVAVNDGKATKVRAWRVKPDIYNRCREGAVVRATISPRLGYVHELQIVDTGAEAVRSSDAVSTG